MTKSSSEINSGILVDWQIEKLRKNGELIITPFNKDHLGTVSYDVTLGEYFIRAHQTKKDTSGRLLFNPASSKSINRRWGKPKKAQSAKKLFTDKELKLHEINPKSKIILLGPGELILCHTNEFVGGVKKVTTSMHARSTVGRSGFAVCMCAGFGDVGYFNRWTMEVHNNSTDYYVVLTVGQRVAQIHFEEVSQPSGLYSKSGHYQTTHDFKKLQKNWSPFAMYPKPLT